MTIGFAVGPAFWLWAGCGFLLGAVIGSFLATLVIRWPQGRSIGTGRSACDGCGRVLGIVDLLPLLGFVLRRGRCATCGAAIDRRHPAIELVCAGIGLISCAAAPGMAGIAGAAFGWLLVALAMLDGEHFWLPDPLVAALGLVGIVGGLAGTEPDLATRLIGGAVGFGALAAISIGYRVLRGRDGMGGGDPKLLGAIGLTLGWAALPLVLLGAASIGLALVAVRWLTGREVRRDQEVPFGALMALVAWPLWLVATLG